MLVKGYRTTMYSLFLSLFWYSTYQDDCPAFIRFTASRDGKALEVSAKNETLNHPISKVSFADHTNVVGSYHTGGMSL